MILEWIFQNPEDENYYPWALDLVLSSLAASAKRERRCSMLTKEHCSGFSEQDGGPNSILALSGLAYVSQLRDS
jgi:hypothetical protein